MVYHATPPFDPTHHSPLTTHHSPHITPPSPHHQYTIDTPSITKANIPRITSSRGSLTDGSSDSPNSCERWAMGHTKYDTTSGEFTHPKWTSDQNISLLWRFNAHYDLKINLQPPHPTFPRISAHIRPYSPTTAHIRPHDTHTKTHTISHAICE